MSTKQLESEIEQACVKIAKEQRCILLKIQGAKGYPDRLLLTPNGKMMFIELKRPGESLRPLQKHVLEDLTSRGYRAEEVDSVTLFKALLTDLLQDYGLRTITKSEESHGLQEKSQPPSFSRPGWEKPASLLKQSCNSVLQDLYGEFSSSPP